MCGPPLPAGPGRWNSWWRFIGVTWNIICQSASPSPSVLPFTLTLILCLSILFVFLIVFCFHASFSVLPLPHHSLRSTFLNTPSPTPLIPHQLLSTLKANLWSFWDWFIHVKGEMMEGASILCWRRSHRQLVVQADRNRRLVSFYAFLETKKWKSVVVFDKRGVAETEIRSFRSVFTELKNRSIKVNCRRYQT